ncbi:TlpA family protein disulfide reductase [Altererythrobacter sp. GH1-8]|uniref:TlpA family protein disulfide reductase n=1 Tax=Altererythrobacter sp. GH1-8 TaxID=3349333 RepID=UPI00374CF71D
MLTVLVPALLLAGCDSEPEGAVQQQEQLSAPKPPLIGEVDYSLSGTKMPVAVFNDTDGKQLDTAALKGKPVLLNLWATWCAPCIIEMPMLDNLADEMGDDLKVLTVSQDMAGGRVVEPFFTDRKFRNLEPWLDEANLLSRELGGALLPVTILFDANGEEVFRVTGGYHWDSEDAVAAVREGIAR